MTKDEWFLLFVLTLILFTGVSVYGLNLHHERQLLLNKDNISLQSYHLVTERERVVNEGVYLRSLELQCTDEFVTRDGEHYRRQWGRDLRGGD